MRQTPRALTIELLIPIALWREWGSPTQAKAGLEAAGVWPPHVWEHRWREDGERGCMVAALQLWLPVVEEAPHEAPTP
jgi:hypothetical protein